MKIYRYPKSNKYDSHLTDNVILQERMEFLTKTSTLHCDITIEKSGSRQSGIKIEFELDDLEFLAESYTRLIREQFNKMKNEIANSSHELEIHRSA